MVWNTGSRSPGVLEITFRTSDVVVCCSSASARSFSASPEMDAALLLEAISKIAAATTIPVVIAHAFGRASVLLGHHLQQWVRFD